MTHKPKLSWFSPLPPAKSAIATYSLSLLEHLAPIWNTTFWTDTAGSKDDDIPYIREFDHRSIFPWSDVNNSEVVVYNIGNNVNYHFGIWNVSRQHAGTV